MHRFGGSMDLVSIKGLGDKTKTLLGKLNIYDVDDLITYYPSRYDILKRSDLDNIEEDEKVIIDGKVESVPLILRFNRGLNKMNFRLASTNKVVGVSIFNRAYMKSTLSIGTNVIVIGKYDKTKEKNNYRNGSTKKILKSEFGHFEFETPRDRNGEFEPKIVPKNIETEKCLLGSMFWSRSVK